MTSSTIKSLVAEKNGKIGIKSRAIPQPGNAEILVRPQAIGLCGTDLEIIDHRIDPDFIKYPVAIGHEWSARIVHDPQDLLNVDTPVVIEGIIPCGICDHCKAGRTNLCETYDEIGFTRDGGASELVSIPRAQVHPLNEKVDLEVATLIEPGAVVYRGLTHINIAQSPSVLIVGDGTIALLSAYLLTLFSPSTVAMLGKRPEQADLAKKSFVTLFTTDKSSLNGRFDICIEASGNINAISTGLEHTKRGGTLLLLGLPPHGEKLPLAVDDLVNNDISLVGSFSYTTKAWKQVVELANSNAFNPDFLITHRYIFDDWKDAINALRRPTGARGKVIIQMAK